MMQASRQNTHLDLICASKPHRRDPSGRADGGECEQISLWMREGMDERETLEREMMRKWNEQACERVGAVSSFSNVGPVGQAHMVGQGVRLIG